MLPPSLFVPSIGPGYFVFIHAMEIDILIRLFVHGMERTRVLEMRANTTRTHGIVLSAFIPLSFQSHHSTNGMRELKLSQLFKKYAVYWFVYF